MKKINLLLVLFALTIGLFTSCEKEDSNNEIKIVLDGNAIVANEGSFGNANGQISIFNGEDGTISNDAYKTINGDYINANLQSINLHEGNLYCLTAGADALHILDATNKLKAEVDPITEGFVTPRYFIANGDIAYVSCYGENYYPNYENSYIAVVDLKERKVTAKIEREGGFEGMAIVGNKLYAASINTKEVAVFNITTNEYIKSIALEGNGRFLIKTPDNNLWVSHSSYVSNDEKGLSHINTTEDKVDISANIPTMGAGGFIAADNEVNNIYVLGKEAYPGTKSYIIKVDGKNGNITSEPVIQSESFYGFNYNKYTNRFYVLIAPDYTNAGYLNVYDATGKELYTNVTTGVCPRQVIFY